MLKGATSALSNTAAAPMHHVKVRQHFGSVVKPQAEKQARKTCKVKGERDGAFLLMSGVVEDGEMEITQPMNSPVGLVFAHCRIAPN